MGNGKRQINKKGNTNSNIKNSDSNKKKGPVKVKDDSKGAEIAAVVMFFAGVFMLLSLFGKTGIIGRVLTSVFYGLFGRAVAIVVLVAVFVIAWKIIRKSNENRVLGVKNTMLFIAFILLLSALIHTLGSDYSKEYAGLNFIDTMSELWTTQLGGVIGGGISCLLQKYLAKAGALVILIPALIIVAILLFSLSVMKIAEKSAGGARAVSAWFKGVRGRFKESKKGKEAPAYVKQEKRKKRQTQVFDTRVEDEDIGEDLDSNLSDMDEVYDMNFNYTTSTDKKKRGKTIEKDDIRREEDLEAIKAVLPGMEETVETLPPVNTKEEIKITTSKFDTIYDAPPFSLLDTDDSAEDLKEEHKRQAARIARKLEETVKSFGIEAKVINISRGAAVTQYELQPHSGVKVSRIKNLAEDIAMNLAAPGIRIEAPIPGKAAIGIEIPNESVHTVYLRDLVETDEFLNHKSSLAFCLGEQISGKPIISDIAKMPHLLIAGSTGSGKSVCVNCMIMSILYRSSPDDVRMIMIDPKVVELGVYNGTPHLLIPVVTEPKKAAAALAWAVQEMENRYKQFAKCGIRDIKSYNTFAYEKGMDKMPRILIIIDELADLMLVAKDSVEDSINRIAAKARAAGIHLVVATQRPSVDVVTGLIKANIPSRIAFKVASQIDSRTILDFAGAEKLRGQGDMLYHPVGALHSTRAQGGFVSDEEIENVVRYLQATYGEAKYDNSVKEEVDKAKILEKGKKGSGGGGGSVGDGDVDELFYEALQIAIDVKQISASFLQRKLGLGYSRASRIIDQLEEKGYISARDGNNPRHVLIDEMPEDA